MIFKKLLNPKFIRWIAAICIFIISYYTWGCSMPEKQIYYPKYRDVYISIPCKLKIPEKLPLTNDALKDNLNILKYTLEIEQTLRACENIK